MITCVTAPSRSGTSLTMQMLQAAGVPLFWNCLPNRTPINPYGHYEFDWKLPLALAEGKAVKVMPFDLFQLTPEHVYRFIVILRNPKCVDASQLDTQTRHGWRPMSDANETEKWQAFTLDFVKAHEHVIVGFDELFNGVAQQRIASMMGFDALQIAKMNDCVDQSLWHFKPEAK